MTSKRFGDTVIFSLGRGQDSTLWVRGDGAVIHYSRGRDTGLGIRNVRSIEAAIQMSTAISGLLGASYDHQQEELLVPSPDMTRLYQAIEATDARIVEILPQAHYLGFRAC